MSRSPLRRMAGLALAVTASLVASALPVLAAPAVAAPSTTVVVNEVYGGGGNIEVLRDAGLTDLGELFDAGRYSYVFDALSGSLDHAMATGSLTAKVTDVAHWNINSVESFAYQYSGDQALYAPHEFRSSDHDPLLVGLDLRPTPGKGPRR